VTHRWGKQTAEDFAALCQARAREAQVSSRASFVAVNGTILEQSQILTTHNLAVLTAGLDLRDRLTELAPDLAERTLQWVVRRQTQPALSRQASLQMLKNAAYAWRQGIFFLSFCDEQTQRVVIARTQELAETVPMRTHFKAALTGLAQVAAGARFNSAGTIDGQEGRRFLGWVAGPHWCLTGEQDRPGQAVRT
jgi:hypothetical protein